MKHFITYFLAIFLFVSTTSSSFGAKYLNVHHYRQCDPQWGSVQLGNCSGYSICNWGCALACMSMLLKTNGTDATPLKLNNFLTANNYWAGGCDMDWIRACQYPGSTMYWTSSPVYSLATVKAQIDANKPVIIKVNPLSGSGDHFVIATGYHNNGNSESDFIVLDPLEQTSKTLNLYNKYSLRLFNNVITSQTVTCEFSFNNIILPSPPEIGFIVWKVPGVTNNFYNLKIKVTNRNGNTYDVYLYRPNGDSVDVALNVNVDILSQSFNIHENNSWFPNSGDYRFKVYKRSNPRELWATSEKFYISSIPQLSVSIMPETLYVGQNATFSWNITGGVPSLPHGGWRGSIQIQWHQNNTPLNTLAFPSVGSSPFTFIVPSSTGGMVPGSNYQLSGSNPPGSAIPEGRVSAYSNYFTISTQSVEISPLNGLIPDKYELYINYPNPFNPTTKIKFDLPESGSAKLRVYDFLGKEVIELLNQELGAGSYEVLFKGDQLPSGVYIYRLETEEFVKSQKMLLIK